MDMARTYIAGTSLLAVALALASPALAQDAAAPVGAAPQQPMASSPGVSDSSSDIIVTATKRVQTLQDVPVSVSVTSQQTIERAQIRDLVDLQSVVPSLKVVEGTSVAETNFYIRGFGNGAGNVGIEGSVGVFIDGVYRSRSAASLNDLPDVERIEVLRGPQSTLFGKNVSAGAINIVTRRPQFKPGGSAELTLGNYGQVIGKATMTGPLSKTLALRVSGNVNGRDGTIRNLVTGTRLNDRNRYSVRGDLLWAPTAQLGVRIIADYNRINERCCGVVQLANGPATQFIGAPRPFGLGKLVGDPNHKFDRVTTLDVDPTNTIVGKGISGEIDYDFGGAKLTSITAYRDQLNNSAQDVDFTGADIASRVDHTRTKTFTQEFRLASDGQGRFNWLVGGFYDHENLKTSSTINFGRDIRPYVDALSGGNIQLFEYLQSLVTPSIIPGRTYFQPGVAIVAPFTLKQDSYSLFGQADYKVTDALTLTGGLAYLSDRKKSASNIVLYDRFSQLNLQNIPQLPFLGIPVNAFGGLSALQFFYANAPTHGPVNYPNANESGVLKGHKLTYLARAQYKLGRVNAYVSYSSGWKSGAFNLSTDARAPTNGVGRTADPENVTLYEAGLKTNFRGGFVNLAVFKQSIKGFQSNAYTGTGYSLVNAGKESVKGFEIDAAARPLPWLALTGALTYLDAKYDSFTRSPCVSFDTVQCPGFPAAGSPQFRDLSGQRPAGIPSWSASTSATISHAFDNGLSAFVRGEYDYSSKVQLIETTPASISTYGVHNVNASVGIASEPIGAQILFWARNLSNTKTVILSFPTVAQSGSYSGFLNEPRTYGVTLSKRF
jgi:iron complex outermembrane receptor protein